MSALPANSNDHPVLAQVAAVLAETDAAGLKVVFALTGGLLTERMPWTEARATALRVADAMIPRVNTTPRARHMRRLAELAVKEGLTAWAITGKSRRKPVARARHKIMWIMRQETGLSYPQLGSLFNRDYTSVIHGVKRHAERMAAGEGT